ncbi:MAG: DUF1326 domain-containing protein [Woeseia sp.]|nr:DUF1326 domain-containing protein [Woeseia sp.]
MKRRDFNFVLGAAAVAPSVLAAAPTWSLEANVAECCSCEIPCPCNFGRATKLRCDGNRLIEIEKGWLGDADLAGIRFLVTFEMGKWSRIYINESLDDAQMESLEGLLPLAFGWFMRQAQTIERVPLSVERTADLITISTPASQVEMKPLVGLDGGQITVSGLPSNVFHNYVQYESVRHIHRGPGREWSHSGTNGFTSRMMANG